MDGIRLRWPLGLLVAGAVVALAYRFLTTDLLLLSALGVAWFAGIVAVVTQADVLPLFQGGGTAGGVFAGVLTFVTVSLQQSLSPPASRAFAVSLTVLGLGLFAAAAGSALTVRAAGAD
jgi:hypothetical protein